MRVLILLFNPVREKSNLYIHNYISNGEGRKTGGKIKHKTYRLHH